MEKRQIDLKDLSVSKKYMELFDCKSNPFPITGVSSGDLGFPPTDEKVTEEVVSFIKSTYDREYYGGLLIIGDYGFGKTYLLKHIERRINEALYYRGTERACAVYIDNPEPPAIEDFIAKFLDRFGMHKFLTLLWHLVSRRFQEKLIEQGKSFLKDFFPTLIQPTLFSKENIAVKEDIFANPLKFIDWLYNSKANLKRVGKFAESEVFLPIFHHPEITEVLSSLDDYSEAETYSKWMWVLNYRTFKTKLKKEIDPAVFFRSILTVFRQNGFRHVYLLVDEFEDVFSRTNKKERLAYCAALRNMIEYNLEYFSIILAVKPDMWERISGDAPIFAERFARKVELLGLTQEQLKSMIKSYLSGVRDSDSPYYNSLYPFEQDAIDEIYRIAHANHRIAVEICYVLFEYAIEKGEKLITANMVRNLSGIRDSLIKARKGKIDL